MTSELATTTAYDSIVQEKTDEIGQSLGALYDLAEAKGDDQALQLVTHSWAKVGELYEATQKLAELTKSVKSLADETRHQRDEALQDFKKLKDAVEDPWGTDDPVVSRLVEVLEENLSEEIWFGMEDYAHESMYENLHMQGTANLVACGIEKATAETFIELLLNDTFEFEERHHATVRTLVEGFVKAVQS